MLFSLICSWTEVKEVTRKHVDVFTRRSGEDLGPKSSFYSLLSVRMSLLAAVVDMQTETKAFFSTERKTPRFCCHISHQNAEVIRKEFKNAAREHWAMFWFFEPAEVTNRHENEVKVSAWFWMALLLSSLKARLTFLLSHFIADSNVFLCQVACSAAFIYPLFSWCDKLLLLFFLSTGCLLISLL